MIFFFLLFILNSLKELIDIFTIYSQKDSDEPAALKALRPGQDLPHIGSDFDLSDVDKTRFPNINDIKKNQPTPKPSPEPPTTPPLSPEQLQQLALYR